MTETTNGFAALDSILPPVGSNTTAGQPTPPAAENKFAVLDEILPPVGSDGNVRQLRNTLDVVSRTNPDDAAEMQRLSTASGLPFDVVQRNVAQVKRQMQINDDVSRVSRLSPMLKQQLQDPFFAAIAHDDIDNLSQTEHLLKSWNGPQPSISSVAGGLLDNLSPKPMLSALKLAMHDAFASDDNIESQVYRQDLQRKALQDQAQRDRLTPDFESATAGALYSGGASFMQALPGLAASIATGSPIPSLASAGVNQGASAYSKYLNRGASKGEAALGALGEGAAEIVFEALPMGYITHMFGKAGAGEFLTGLAARELPTEQATTFVQDAIDTAIANPEKTWGDYWAERPEAGYQTLVATLTQGGVMGGIHAVARRLTEDGQQAEQAQSVSEFIGQLNQLAAANKVNPRNPGAMKNFVDSIIKDTAAENIYIDAHSFAQSGVAEKVSAVLPDVAAQLPEALATGGEVRIPVSDYYTQVAGTEYAQPLLEHIRVEGQEASLFETNQFKGGLAGERLAQDFERAMTQHQADENFQVSTQAVKDAIKQQLATVSRFTDKVNDHYASLLSNFYAVQADKFGKTPQELFSQYPVNVAASGLVGQSFNQPQHTTYLTGTEFAEPDMNIKELRAATKSYYENNLANTSVHNPSLGDIKFTPRGLKKAIATSANPLKLRLFAALPDILKNGELIRTQDNTHAKTHSNIKRYHWIRGHAVIDGKSVSVEVNVEEHADGKLYYNHTLPGYEYFQSKAGVQAQSPSIPGELSAAEHHSAAVEPLPEALGPEPSAGTVLNSNDGINLKINEKQFYNQRRSAKRDDYTLDLFGVPTEIEQTDNAGTETRKGLSRDDVPAGTYATRTQIVQENTRQLGTDQVNTPQEAAQALAYLANSAVERFEALVTDKDGTPLAIAGSFKGAINRGDVHIATVTGEAFRIEGAANIWFAHNHPSGLAEFSDLDRAIYHKLDNVFRGSEITPRGFLAIGGKEGDGRQWVFSNDPTVFGDNYEDIKGVTAKVKGKPKATPVVERVYAEEDKLAQAINTPEKAKTIAEDLSDGESGVMLMDNQHAPVAFIPVKSAESEVLRNNGRIDALHRALSMSNASAAIIVNQGDMTNNAVMNLAGFFHGANVRLLDVLDKNGEGMDSRSEVGLSFSRDTFNQGSDANRGAFNPETRTITLLDHADLSTFLHESGHFFLEMQFDLAANLLKEDDLIGTTSAQKQLMADTDALLQWFGLQSIEEWYSLDFEQKRSYHEQFAEGFEKYLFEGNAPSLQLARIFASFRQWMKKVYEHVRDHFKDIELSDEVRQVFDRMLATDEEIKLAQQARSMMPLFADQATSGMTPEEYADYQAAGKEATSTAMEQLALKGLRDMQWLQNARNRELKKLQKQHDELRREVRSVVRMEVMAQPVYQAYNFLTRKLTADDKVIPPTAPKSDPKHVDASQDSLFVAIAKLGGLQRSQLTEEWNYDHDGREKMPVFGKPVVRKTGGHSIEAMAEMLLEEGYLTPDQHGKHDLSEFEQKFSDELRGVKQYSSSVDGNLFREEGIAGSEIINPEGLAAGRFELSALQGMFLPEEVVNQIVNLKMTARDGLHPDVVSELFGFSSGDELVKALAAAPSPKEAIEQLTDERMLQNYGDLSTPEAIQRAADMAIHNEVRARFVTTEANALAKATGSLRILGNAAKEFAENMIAQIKVRDISPVQYTRAEVRAARASLRAEKAGKLDVAAAEKRNQIINMHAMRAAYQAQDDVDAGLRYFRKLETGKNAIDPEYKDQIYRQLERFDLRKVSNAALDRRKSLAQWVESQKEQGYEPDIPLELLDEATKISYKDMTLGEFRGLVDTIKQIEHLGRLKNRLLTAKKNSNFDEVKQEIVGSIIHHAGNRTANTRSPTTNSGRMLQGIKNFYASHVKAATWARILDGGQDGGAMWEYFVRSANDRGEYETTLRSDATEKLTAILEPVLKMGKMGGKGQYFPSIDRSLNREMRLAMALNTGNDGNLQRLLDGEGWTISRITPVLQTLTAEEWQAVQQIWDYFETYKPEIAAKERRIYGKEPNWVEPKPVIVQCKTAAGVPVELRLLGGYYPIKYDPVASQRAEQHADAEEAKRQLQGAYTSATTRRSFTKNRSEMILGRPLLYSLSGVYSGINEVIHDLAWHEWLIDMNKLLKSHSIDKAIRGHYGPEVVRQFKSWEQDIAAGDVAATNAGEIALGKLRQGISAAGLGFNAMSAAMQVLGLTQSIVRVGAPWMGRGISRFIGDPKGSMKEVLDKSAFMNNRSRTRFRELNELRNRVQDETAAQAAIRTGAFFMMMKAQQLVDVPTWLGAYEKAIADLNDEERAIALADQAVIDAQGGGQMKDLSAIERGGPAMKLFTVFYSFMNTAFNLGVAQTMTEKKKAKLSADYLMLYSVPPVLGFFLKEALTPGGGDDDWEELSKKLLAQQIDYLMGLMVIVREFSDAVKTVTGANDMGRDYQGPAGMRFFVDAGKLATQMHQGEFDDAFRKSAINVIGDLSGLPSAQVNRTITGAEALHAGKTENPAALAFGFRK